MMHHTNILPNMIFINVIVKRLLVIEELIYIVSRIVLKH